MGGTLDQDTDEWASTVGTDSSCAYSDGAETTAAVVVAPVCVCVHVYVCMRTCVCACVHMHVCVCTCLCVFTCLCLCARTHLCMCVCASWGQDGCGLPTDVPSLVLTPPQAHATITSGQNGGSGDAPEPSLQHGCSASHWAGGKKVEREFQVPQSSWHRDVTVLCRTD